jgi:hypothetical protein
VAEVVKQQSFHDRLQLERDVLDGRELEAGVEAATVGAGVAGLGWGVVGGLGRVMGRLLWHCSASTDARRRLIAPAPALATSPPANQPTSPAFASPPHTPQELMWRGAEMLDVLRLVVLLSVCNGGLPRKQYDALRAELLAAYGHEQLLALLNLERAGLLKQQVQQQGRANFAAVKRAFR